MQVKHNISRKQLFNKDMITLMLIHSGKAADPNVRDFIWSYLFNESCRTSFGDQVSVITLIAIRQINWGLLRSECNIESNFMAMKLLISYNKAEELELLYQKYLSTLIFLRRFAIMHGCEKIYVEMFTLFLEKLLKRAEILQDEKVKIEAGTRSGTNTGTNRTSGTSNGILNLNNSILDWFSQCQDMKDFDITRLGKYVKKVIQFKFLFENVDDFEKYLYIVGRSNFEGGKISDNNIGFVFFWVSFCF